jgi:hypothetical protein
LNENASKGAKSDFALVELKTVSVRALPKGNFCLEVGTDFVELDLKLWVGVFQTSEAAHGMNSVCITTAFDEPTR